MEFLYGDHEQPISIKEAYSSVRFKKIIVMFMFGIFIGLYIASAYKISADPSVGDEYLTVAGSLGAVCNGLSRIFWG